MPIDLNDPADKAAIDEAVKAAVTSAVAEATSGLKSNRDTILAEKKTLEDKMKELNSQFEGVDPKLVKSLYERIKNDEETKLISEGKLDEVLNRRTDSMKKDFEARLTQSQTRGDTLEQGEKALKQKMNDLVIEGIVRQAAVETGVVPAAIEDAIYRAKKVFLLDESFVPMAKDANGAPILGKDAKTPISAKEWLESMKEKSPHWFPGSTGAGAGGGGKGGLGGAVHVLSREDARNPQKYQAAKTAAEKAGTQLQISD